MVQKLPAKVLNRTTPGVLRKLCRNKIINIHKKEKSNVIDDNVEFKTLIQEAHIKTSE